MNNGRDCPHGRQVGKCDTCDLITAELELEKVKAERDSFLAELQKANGIIIDLQRNPPKLLKQHIVEMLVEVGRVGFIAGYHKMHIEFVGSLANSEGAEFAANQYADSIRMEEK